MYPKLTGYHNGYQYVDLGLSVLWATCNIGASNPWDYGNYYYWGGLNPNSSKNDDAFTRGWDYEDESDGQNIPENRLSIEYDTARNIMGGLWRMPTSKEQKELMDKSTRTWTKQGNNNGCLITSTINSQQLFLPAAGKRYNGSDREIGQKAYYSSSSFFAGIGIYGHIAITSSEYELDDWSDFGTYDSVPVRAVLDK